MDFITDAQCQQIVEVHKKSKYEKIKHFNVSKTFEIPQTPNGHLGEYFTLEITLQNGEVLRYFVKKILTTPNRPDFINLVMRKEINFYKWLNSTETTTAAVEISFCVPKYYLSTDNFIVMELLDPFQPLTREDFKHEYFKSAAAALAKLHALVIFVERQTPPEEEMVTEAMLTKTVYIEAITKGVMKYLAHSNYDQDLPWKFKEKVQKMIELFTEDKQNQFKIVCHGDLWINNLLFNKNQCKIIDYQLIRRAEPAHDLCTLLIHNLGFNHFAEFCNLYYDELVTECLKFNVDIIREFSRIDFEASIKRHATSALITKIIYAAFSSANKLRKAQRLNIALDHLMAQNDYDFLLAITTMDQEEKLIFDGLFHDFVQFESNQWVTTDVVHRFMHQCFPGAVLCDFKFKDGVLCVKLTFDGVFKEVKFTVRQPNVLYEFFPIAACGDLQKCYFYLKNDLMIMECLEDTHKRLNLREPFGLTDVKVILKALANFHALSYLHQNKSENVPRKTSIPLHLRVCLSCLDAKLIGN
ncbi:uncharacterized protein [Atheta coriaria]|uniref:uncharacterized protein n=1 Tax=Dalotia coriaria TaxID=877792 RepID=UPI0031F37276